MSDLLSRKDISKSYWLHLISKIKDWNYWLTIVNTGKWKYNTLTQLTYAKKEKSRRVKTTRKQ